MDSRILKKIFNKRIFHGDFKDYISFYIEKDKIEGWIFIYPDLNNHPDDLTKDIKYLTVLCNSNFRIFKRVFRTTKFYIFEVNYKYISTLKRKRKIRLLKEGTEQLNKS